MFACGPADATASQTPSSLASFKSRLVSPFWYLLTQVASEKSPLNGYFSSHPNDKFLELFGCKPRFSTVLHPGGNSSGERLNQSLKRKVVHKFLVSF